MRKRMQDLRLRAPFEAKRAGRFVDYHLKYQLQFGALHLVNPTHRRPWKQVYDLDIKAGLLFVVFLCYQVLRLQFTQSKRMATTETNKACPIDKPKATLIDTEITAKN